jgi:hypothetical protein
MPNLDKIPDEALQDWLEEIEADMDELRDDLSFLEIRKYDIDAELYRRKVVVGERKQSGQYSPADFLKDIERCFQTEDKPNAQP